MLLDSFKRQLDVRRFLPQRGSAGRFGSEAAESFVVDIRVSLTASKRAEVDLPNVGALNRKGDDLRFSPAAGLTLDASHNKLRLSELWGLNWPFQKRPVPEPGFDLLSSVALQFFTRALKEDLKLERDYRKELVSIFCLSIHDAICAGAGVELETVGTFRPDCGFEIDQVLNESLKHLPSSALSKDQAELKVLHQRRASSS